MLLPWPRRMLEDDALISPTCSLPPEMVTRRLMWMVRSLIPRTTSCHLNSPQTNHVVSWFSFISLTPSALVRRTFSEALVLLQKVVSGKWDVRFSQVELTALTELNRLASFLRHHSLDYELLVR